MTREERKTAGALKKDLPKIVKPLMKPYGFPLAIGRVWGREDDMLYVMIPLIRTKEPVVLHTGFLAKPVFTDDCLWDIPAMKP